MGLALVCGLPDLGTIGWPGLESSEAPSGLIPGLPKTPVPAPQRNEPYKYELPGMREKWHGRFVVDFMRRLKGGEAVGEGVR